MKKTHGNLGKKRTEEARENMRRARINGLKNAPKIEVKCQTTGCENIVIRYVGIAGPVRKYCAVCVLERAREAMRQIHKREKEDPKQDKKRREGVHRRNQILKISVLTHYGKNHKLLCCWRGCKVDDLDCLTLDHIENNGAEFRREITSKRKSGGGGGRETFRFVGRMNFPEGFQTLCANHQLKKEILRRRNMRKVKTNESSR